MTDVDHAEELANKTYDAHSLGYHMHYGGVKAGIAKGRELQKLEDEAEIKHHDDLAELWKHDFIELLATTKALMLAVERAGNGLFTQEMVDCAMAIHAIEEAP